MPLIEEKYPEDQKQRDAIASQKRYQAKRKLEEVQQLLHEAEVLENPDKWQDNGFAKIGPYVPSEACKRQLERLAEIQRQSDEWFEREGKHWIIGGPGCCCHPSRHE